MPVQYAQDSDGRVYEYKRGRWELRQAPVSAGEAVMIGAGRTFTSLGRGIADLVAAPGAQINPAFQEFRQGLAQAEASEAPIFGQLQAEQPIPTTIGQLLPYLASAPLTLNSVPGTMALEGAIGAAEYGTLQERLLRGGFAAAAGGAGATLAQRVQRGIQNSAATIAARQGDEFLPGTAGAAQAADVGQVGRQSGFRRLANIAGEQAPLTDAQELAVNNLARRGYQLEPGMASNNRVARFLSASAKRQPGFADIMAREIEDVNDTLFTRQTLRALGQSGDEFNDSTILQIEQRLNDTFDAIRARNPQLKGANRARDELQRLRDSFSRGVRTTGKFDPEERRLEKLIAEMERLGDEINTERYAQWRSEYRAVQRSGQGAAPDPNKVSTAGDVVEILDEWFGRNVAPDDAQEYFAAVQQFRLLRSLDKPQVLGTDLKLRPQALARELRKSYSSEFWKNDKFGTLEQFPEIKQLFEDVRSLAKFPEIVPNSGTATNQAVANIFGDRTALVQQMAFRPLLRQWIKAAQPVIE